MVKARSLAVTPPRPPACTVLVRVMSFSQFVMSLGSMFVSARCAAGAYAAGLAGGGDVGPVCEGQVPCNCTMPTRLQVTCVT